MELKPRWYTHKELQSFPDDMEVIRSDSTYSSTRIKTALVLKASLYEDEMFYPISPIPDQSKEFSFEQVCETLCDCCKYGIPSSYDWKTSSKTWYHKVNGEYIPCGASSWRNAPINNPEEGIPEQPSSSGGQPEIEGSLPATT